MAFDTPQVADLKRRLRNLAKRRRRDLSVEPEKAAQQAAENFMEAIAPKGLDVVAGYAAYLTELNAWPLIHCLHEAEVKCSLPVLSGSAQALRFRQWRPNGEMAANQLGILEPVETAAELRPDIVVTPLLAFDRQGHRLGYGGGYYDRTLQHLRAQGKVIAIGFGYGFQEVDDVPADGLDQRLDWIVTDDEVIRIAG